MDVERARVRCPNEVVRDEALPDDQLGGDGLVLGSDEGGRQVVHANAA